MGPVTLLFAVDSLWRRLLTTIGSFAVACSPFAHPLEVMADHSKHHHNCRCRFCVKLGWATGPQAFPGYRAPHDHPALPSRSPRPPRSIFLHRGELEDMAATLLEICPEAHGGYDCRFHQRMRARLNATPYACYTSFGLCSFFSDVFRLVQGDPPRTAAYIVFLPMIRPIVRHFWLDRVALNDLARFDQCHQHSPEGLACRDCVSTHPYFDTNV